PSRNLSDNFDLTKDLRAKPSRDSAYQMEAPDREVALVESAAESSVGAIVEQAENGESPDTTQPAEMVGVSASNGLTEVTAAMAPQAAAAIPESIEEITQPTQEASDTFDGAKETSPFEEELTETPQDAEIELPAATALTELPVESVSLDQPVPDEPVSVIPTPVLARAATFAS